MHQILKQRIDGRHWLVVAHCDSRSIFILDFSIGSHTGGTAFVVSSWVHSPAAIALSNEPTSQGLNEQDPALDQDIETKTH